MEWVKRIRALDIALGAVVLVAVVAALVTIPGYRWGGTIDGGFMKHVPAAVTLEVTQPSLLPIASAFESGAFAAETPRGNERVVIASVERSPDGASVRIQVRLTAEVDRGGRAFWSDHRLRVGDGLSIADGRRRVSGTIVSVEGLDSSPR